MRYLLHLDDALAVLTSSRRRACERYLLHLGDVLAVVHAAEAGLDLGGRLLLALLRHHLLGAVLAVLGLDLERRVLLIRVRRVDVRLLKYAAAA